MIIGRQLVERMYSESDYTELEDLMERAFCEGYEYAQREFGRTGKSAEQAKKWFAPTGNRQARKELELGIGLGNVDDYPQAKTKKQAEDFLRSSIKVGRDTLREGCSTNYNYTDDWLKNRKYKEGDCLINLRGNLFPNLSTKSKIRSNKSIYNANSINSRICENEDFNK